MKTKDKILFTALELFNRKGYEHVKVREIARELGISPGNLSYHFSRKEDVLLSLLGRFRASNDALYENYEAGAPSNKNFLHLIQKIFYSQYKFRGLFMGNPSVRQELQATEQFNYSRHAKRRQENFEKIFRGLVSARHLIASETDLGFLVSFMSLFGRFWIMEAFLTQKEIDENQAIHYYLTMLARQLSLFATPEGKKSIDDFLAQIQD